MKIPSSYTYSEIMDQQGKVANPARGQLNKNLVSRDGFGSVPSRVNLLISILRLNLVLTYYGIPPEFGGSVHLFIKIRHTPSGQSRVYQVTPMRITDGVHCRESAGTGPVNLKVVPNQCCPCQVTMDQLICASLSHHPLLV